MLAVILATGPSMNAAVADAVRHLPRVAVNLAHQLAPDADALAANDAAFWNEYPDALKFAGRKFSANQVRGVERIQTGGARSVWCSGVLGLQVAHEVLKADRILLLGLDFKGGHYFGRYQGRCLKSVTRWGMHRQQFKDWQRNHKGVEVLNCTAGSALDVFPIVPLEQVI